VGTALIIPDLFCPHRLGMAILNTKTVTSTLVTKSMIQAKKRRRRTKRKRKKKRRKVKKRRRKQQVHRRRRMILRW
jgi:hypothetical protein